MTLKMSVEVLDGWSLRSICFESSDTHQEVTGCGVLEDVPLGD